MAKTPTQQGIMSLPETDQATAPTLSLNESYGAAKQGLGDADPRYAQMYDEGMAEVMPTLLALTDEQLDALLQLIQYLQDHPEEYTQRVQELEADGTLGKGDLPAEYDENFLATFGAAILEAQKNNEPAAGPAMQPPATMARGGIAEAARMVANQGRTGDTMLAHITKDEAKMLRKHGGVGTVNPRTGLPEYSLWGSIKSAVSSVGKGISSAVKSVGSAVKSVLSSPIGRIVATVALAAFIGPAAFGLSGAAGVAAQYGLASAGVTALGGGNMKDVVRSGVTGAVAGYGGATLSPVLGSVAAGAGATATGMGLIQGKSVKDSVKDGLTSAAIAGAMSYANQSGISRGTTSPDQAGNVEVNQQTGQVSTGGQPPSGDVLAGVEGADIPTGDLTTPVSQVSNGTPDWLKEFTVQPPAAEASAPPAGEWKGLTNWAAESQNMSPVNQSMVAGQSFAPTPSTLDTVTGSVGDWWDKNISPSGIKAEGANTAADAYQTKYDELIASGKSPAAADTGAKIAAQSATPGMLATYGPSVGIGMLGVSALGGFKQNEPPPSALQTKLSGTPGLDLINQNPSAYIPQNLQGIQYDATGNITGSAPWTPSVTGSMNQPTEVASTALPYAPSGYQTPTGAITNLPAGQTIAQPYNLPLPYVNLFQPVRRAADGGYMSSTFPMSPLNMDRGPAMAQMASPVSMNTSGAPMNTPGVPMNLPMQYAVGGIASLAVGGYPRRTGQISGPGTETSDSIPAMLSDGEFVMTAKAVRGAGKGNRMAGAKKMYALMHQLEKNAARG